MSSPSELIVNAKHFSPDAIAYQSAKVNSRGGKSVQIRLQGQPLVLAIPLMFTWGINDFLEFSLLIFCFYFCLECAL